MCKRSEYISVLHAVNIDVEFYFLFDEPLEVSIRDTVAMTWLSFVWGLTWHRLVPYLVPLFSITNGK
jgi:hypothetical protein